MENRLEQLIQEIKILKEENSLLRDLLELHRKNDEILLKKIKKEL
jgi:hypothetical protein